MGVEDEEEEEEEEDREVWEFWGQASKQDLCMPNRRGKHVGHAATGEELTRTWPHKIQGWFLLQISNSKSS